MMWTVSGVYFLCFTVYFCTGTSPANKTPSLKPEEQYQDLFPLTHDNFTESVLRNKDPWIIVFHDGSFEREWKTMATHLRGLCWCGLVDTNTEKKLLETLKYEASEGTARFYPYGDRKTKQKKWRNVRNQNEARVMALQSLPDRTERVRGGDLANFLLDSFTSSPSRFPAYIITDSDDTPFVIKAIAKRFERYFLFGKVVKPDTDELSKLGLGKVYVNPPELFVMVTRGGRPESIDAIKFDKDRHGLMNYTSIVQYLFQINTNFRHDLPGNHMAGIQEVAEMADVLEIESKRFEIVRDDDRKEPIDLKETGSGKIKYKTEVGVKDEL